MADPVQHHARGERARGSQRAGDRLRRSPTRAAPGDRLGSRYDRRRSPVRALAAALPLERGRTLLALGSVQRRARKRSAARGSLGEAVATFDRIGARLWAEKARAELGRIGGRAGSPRGLTQAEQRVAALVAEGKTNKEVAADLVVSVRTVEANLSRIYDKLGIRSRTELARRYRADEQV